MSMEQPELLLQRYRGTAITAGGEGDNVDLLSRRARRTMSPIRDNAPAVAPVMFVLRPQNGCRALAIEVRTTSCRISLASLSQRWTVVDTLVADSVTLTYARRRRQGAEKVPGRGLAPLFCPRVGLPRTFPTVSADLEGSTLIF